MILIRALEVVASEEKAKGCWRAGTGSLRCGYENGVELLESQNCKRRKSSKGLGFDQPGANSQRPPASSDNNPVQALADALVGFSEVYSRIEVAKMELFTKMNLELARLRKRRRKNGGSGSVSGFSSVSVSSSSASSDSEEE